jgi:Uma2 family endonuclease
MSVLANAPPTDRVIIPNISWATYESLLKDLENQSSPRLAYDQGVLEIMTVSFGHEAPNEILADIVKIALEELDIDFVSAGSTTFKRESLKRGFEPAASFYIRNAARIRGKKQLDMEFDPPPELILEVDVTNDSMNKFPIYASIGVSEVWRYNTGLEIRVLEKTGYVRRTTSQTIPVLNEQLISELLASSTTTARPAWSREVRKRIRPEA